jgi:hypothetical protein
MKRLRLHILLLFVLSFLFWGSGSASIQSGQSDPGSLANTTSGEFSKHVEEGYKQIKGSVYHNAQRTIKLSGDAIKTTISLGQLSLESLGLFTPVHSEEVPAATSFESLSSQIDSVDESDTDLNFGLKYSSNNHSYPQPQTLPLPDLDKRVVLIPLESGIAIRAP